MERYGGWITQETCTIIIIIICCQHNSPSLWGRGLCTPSCTTHREPHLGLWLTEPYCICGSLEQEIKQFKVTLHNVKWTY